MYRHILIPTDGSELAEHGVAHGLALAKSVGANVSIIFVIEPFPEMTGPFLEKIAGYVELRHRSSRGQRLRSHCYVIAWTRRTFHASNRQCDKQGADLRENPRAGLSVNSQTARRVKLERTGRRRTNRDVAKRGSFWRKSGSLMLIEIITGCRCRCFSSWQPRHSQRCDQCVQIFLSAIGEQTSPTAHGKTGMAR